jgi:hypothetical protein
MRLRLPSVVHLKEEAVPALLPFLRPGAGGLAGKFGDSGGVAGMRGVIRQCDEVRASGYWRMTQTTIASGATVPKMKESAFCVMIINLDDPLSHTSA